MRNETRLNVFVGKIENNQTILEPTWPQLNFIQDSLIVNKVFSTMCCPFIDALGIKMLILIELKSHNNDMHGNWK